MTINDKLVTEDKNLLITIVNRKQLNFAFLVYDVNISVASFNGSGVIIKFKIFVNCRIRTGSCHYLLIFVNIILNGSFR
jgi:hypothetical protein